MEAPTLTGAQMKEACAKMESKMEAGVLSMWGLVKTADDENQISAFYQMAVAPLMAAQTEEDALKQKKETAFNTKKDAFRAEIMEEYKALVEKEQTPKSVAKEVGRMLWAKELERMKKEVEAEFSPTKKGKKKGSGKRRAVDEDNKHPDWTTNTEEDAKKDYEDPKNYATAEDLADKKCYEENACLYKKGDKTPAGHPTLTKGDILEKDLVKKTWRSCVRKGATFQDPKDKKRCLGAKIFKGGRYGSIYTSEQGIKGRVVYQCDGERVDNGYCKGCAAGTKKNFFTHTYPKSKKGNDIRASEYLTISKQCGC